METYRHIGPKQPNSTFKALYLSQADLTQFSPKSQNFWAFYLERSLKNLKAFFDWALCPMFPRGYCREEGKGSEDGALSPYPCLSLEQSVFK